MFNQASLLGGARADGVHQLIYPRSDGEGDPYTYSKGPKSKYARRAPHAGGEESTMSNSSRSTANQSAFRFRVVLRDFNCLLTQAPAEDCIAAHIIPQSRPEHYTEILGFAVPHPFAAQHGITLSHDLHHAFENGDFGLWPQGDDLNVH